MTIVDLSALLDRPVAFQRPFVALGAGVTAALMLSQAVYWTRRTKDPEGWFYKSQEEWTDETGLTRYEQENARKKLCALGVLEEVRKSTPARLFYRVNTVVLYEKLLGKPAAKTTGETTNPDCGKPAIKDAENPPASSLGCRTQDGGSPAISLTENTTETTTEITAETTQQGGKAKNLPEVLSKQKQAKQDINAELGPLPEWIPADAWAAFVEMRESMGKSGRLTVNAAKMVVKKLGELRAAGHPPGAVLEQSVMSNWKGVFPLKGQQVAGGRQQQLEDRNRQAIDEFVNGGRNVRG